jgi:NNP family nitrate/nitrite transporter-like MFS transporter
MTNAATLYFIDRFGLNTETAAAISSIFGWMNLFARGLGGFVSDILNMKMGMKGRLIWQSISILFEGSLVIAFSFTHSLATAIVTMTCFSLFVQSSEGSTFSIVPYVLPRMNGFVSGIVGAGGSLGGVIFLVMFRYMNYQRAFIGMGLCAVVSSFLSVFLCFDREDEIIVDQSGHGGMISDRKVDERHPREDNVLSSFPIRISDGESNTV